MKTFGANFKFKIFQYPVLLVINLNLQEKSYRSQKQSSGNSRKKVLSYYSDLFFCSYPF